MEVPDREGYAAALLVVGALCLIIGLLFGYWMGHP
jgi:hypothetical protein